MALEDIPEWREIVTVKDFVLAVRDALHVWLLVHTDPECWAAEWTCDEPEWAFKESEGVIRNDRFSFDWKGAVYKEMAENWLSTTSKCPRCGMLLFEGRELDCDCWKEDEEPETELCTEEDLEDIVEFMEDCCTEPEPSRALDALVRYGFSIYRDALERTIATHVDEMRLAVQALSEAVDADDRWNMLTMAREATRIYHVNGEVMQDYGERVGLDFSLVDQVRSEGYAEVFGEEEVRAFLEVAYA